MTLSMHQASAPAFVRMLQSLSKILDKAEAAAETRKIDPAVFLNYRLAPDMFPLSRQVQLATDFAKGAMARLSGAEPPKYEDTEKSFADLRVRLAKTVKFVESFKAKDIDGSEQREITITVGGQQRKFTGQEFLIGFALPNFYFHVTTAYAILRHCGLDIGKRDFMGVA